MGVALGDVIGQRFVLGDVQVLRAYQGDDLVWGFDPVEFTVEGTTFEPWLVLTSGSTASVQWLDDSDNVLATGVTPTISLPDATPRTVRLVADKPWEIETLNLGFQHEQDNGLYSLSSGLNYVTQPVTAVTNLQYLSGLKNFMAARTNGTDVDPDLYVGPVLGGALDISGLAALEYVECFRAEITSADLTGCASMIRLCFEQTALTTLDLNPVRLTLRDLRGAYQAGGSLTLTPLAGPLVNLYHFCLRRQQVNNMPDMSYLPMVRQFWMWRCGLSIDTLEVRSSDTIHSIILSSADPEGPNNSIRVIDVAGQTFGSIAGDSSDVRIRADNVGLEELILTGVTTPIEEFRVLGNNMLGPALDHLVTTVDSWGTSGGLIRMQNNDGRVGEAGYAAVQNLLGRGWTVEYTSPLGPTITTAVLPVLTEGIGTDSSLLATGDGTITWAVTAGTLPAGLTLDSDGRLHGTPTTAGAYDFTVTATNFVGTDTQQYTGSVVEPGTPPLWSDEFDTPGVGWANSGGWFPLFGSDTDVVITGGQLVWSGTQSYRGAFHDGGGSLPADLEVVLGFTRTSTGEGPGDGTYWGVAARGDGTNGVRVIFRGQSDIIRIGAMNSSSDGTDIDIDTNVDPSWYAVGSHEVGLRCVGTSVTVWLDGVQVGSRTYGTNSTLVGGDIGIIGEPQGRAWDYIRVYDRTP